MSNVSIHPLGLKGKGWTPTEEEQLIQLYKLNYSYEEISKILGRSVSSVHGKLCLIKKLSGIQWDKKDS
ncbi:MAG: hypothetical protein QXN63_00230 [Candidatus Bathyarchaeia archaeon]